MSADLAHWRALTTEAVALALRAPLIASAVRRRAGWRTLFNRLCGKT